MTGFLRQLFHDRAGSPAVEMGFALPVLVVVIVGVLQLGMAFQAQAGLRNGIEAGARSATIFPYPTSDLPIKTAITDNTFGLSPLGTATATANPTECGANTGTKYSGTVSGTSDSYQFVICRGKSNSENFVEVSGLYPVRLNFLFITTPAFNLNYSRRVYQM